MLLYAPRQRATQLTAGVYPQTTTAGPDSQTNLRKAEYPSIGRTGESEIRSALQIFRLGRCWLDSKRVHQWPHKYHLYHQTIVNRINYCGHRRPGLLGCEPIPTHPSQNTTGTGFLLSDCGQPAMESLPGEVFAMRSIRALSACLFFTIIYH